MDSLNGRRLDVLERVCNWAERQGQALFAPGTSATASVARIQGAVRVANRACQQQRSGYGGTQRRRCRRELRSALMTLARATQKLHAEAPGLTFVYHRPPYRSDEALIDFAEGMLGNLEPDRERLLAVLDLPPDYFDVVRARMQALEAASSDQDAARRFHVDAGATIDTALREGFAALKGLDGILRHQLEGKPLALGSWFYVRRIHRSNHRRRRIKREVA